MQKQTDRERWDEVLNHLHQVRAAVNAAEETVATVSVRFGQGVTSKGLMFPPAVKVALDKLYDNTLTLAIKMQEFESPS
jgi:hypothetical protein